MPRILRMIEEIVRGTNRFLRVYISSVAGREVPMAEHRGILDAAKKGDAKRAVRLLEAHIDRTRRMLEENAAAPRAAGPAPAKGRRRG
jgi:DNA-binding GntR family transcriptional regulator